MGGDVTFLAVTFLIDNEIIFHNSIVRIKQGGGRNRGIEWQVFNSLVDISISVQKVQKVQNKLNSSGLRNRFMVRP